LPLDVCDDNSVSTCARTVLSEADNRLDVLVNNAGYLLEGPLEEVTL
jgi:NADP-dependent 3-hydroxy acid dehydrogenase YdfG